MDDPVIYIGKEELVLAFDLGATQSAVSFVHFIPGSTPVVRFVNHWPGQEEAAGHSKTPSLICYEKGHAIAFGAEAANAWSHDSQLARWFKLHLNPPSIRFSMSSLPHLEELPPLPRDVTLSQVYSDFFRYMFDHTRHFFKTTTPDGPEIWNRLQDSIAFVLATPNGWDDVQQNFLSRSLVQAGLLQQKFEPDRLRFVTESEASIHSVLHHHSRSGWLSTGDLVALVDAGGATVDTTLYTVTGSTTPSSTSTSRTSTSRSSTSRSSSSRNSTSTHLPSPTPNLVLEEVCASECVQAGSAFVDLEAENILRSKLSGSIFGDDDFLLEMVAEFERKTKRKFDGSKNTSVIRFGRETDNDRNFGISRGRLNLSHTEIKQIFEVSLSRILASTQKLFDCPQKTPKYLLLVGGYGASPYLQKCLKKAWESSHVEVVAVDDSTHKAAAEGAALWMIKNLVSARAARATYGVPTCRTFDKTIPSHRARAHLAYTSEAFGSLRLPGGLDLWVKKGQVIPESQQKTTRYASTWSSIEKARKSLSSFQVEVLAYEGEDDIEWFHDLNGKYLPGIRHVCTLEADLSSLEQSIQTKQHPDGQMYFQLTFMVAVLFGGTSLQACLQWIEGNKLREGPIAIIPVD